jgi:hypothetical protein
MGPVAQLVFKTSAVVQPTARSVRLRRRSVEPVPAGQAEPEPCFFAARFSDRRALSVFCGGFFCDFFGFSERFAIGTS